MTTLSGNSIQFIEAVRRQLMAKEAWKEAPRDHQIALIIHFQRIFGSDTKTNPNPRKKVLSAILGKEIVTQKQLSATAHQVLLKEMEDGKSDAIIRNIAEALEARAFSEPWNLYSGKVREIANLSVLPADNITGQPRLA